MKRIIFFQLFLVSISTLFAQETDSIIDIRDGLEYKVVKIGQQWWMQENLNIGTRIDGTQDAVDNEVIEKYCYDDNPANCETYGGLYQWDEMMDYDSSDNENPGITRGVCPVGWHLPTDDEWTELTNFLGGEPDAGGKLKETGTIHWLSPNTGATNESGFTALAGGYRHAVDGSFHGVNDVGFWWSSTENSTTYWYWFISYQYSNVFRHDKDKKYGYSVRCVRDSYQFGYLTISDKNLKTISKLEFTDDRTIDTIVIINSSVVNIINISSIHTNTLEYSANKSSAILLPGDSIHLNVTFHPSAGGIHYLDTLRIESDDPYLPVISIPLNGCMNIDSVIDIRDNQIYNVVKIGQQWWMQENLNIGTRIDGSQDAADNGTIEKYCYDDNPDNCETYGGLYTWDEMMDYNPIDYGNPGITQGVCPVGWHLPTDSEWTELTDFLGGESVAGGKLKETGTIHWISPNTGASNESSFTALPGGHRHRDGTFYGIGNYGNWRSSTEYGATDAWYRTLEYDYASIIRSFYYKEYGHSVRCVSDFCQFGYLTISDKNLTTISKLDFNDDRTIDTIVIINSSAGNNTINVSSIHTNTSVYNLNKSSAVLSPGDSIHLIIAFDPPIKRTHYLDTLRLESDDPYRPIISIPLNGLKQDSIIDIRDNQVYKVVKIGPRWWMQENLNIGTRIDGSQNATDNGVIEKYCYDNIEACCDTFGGLYQWSEMMDYNPSDEGNPGITQGICPVGWHLPSDDEWTEMTDFLGGSSIAGGKLKETGTIHWDWPNTGATNESGFTALPGGGRSDNGAFYSIGNNGNWWSSTEYTETFLGYRRLYSSSRTIGRNGLFKEYGFSVRCLRDYSQYSYLTISDTNFRSVTTLNFYGDNIREELILINSSAGNEINISSINTNNSDYILNQSSATLSPGDTLHLTITFNPPLKDIYPDTLFVQSDDPYDSLIIIPLNGTFPPEISFTDSINISCFGYSDGSATITPSLGTPPYEYQWDDSGNTTDSIATGLSANIYYHVTVTDSLEWTITDSIILSEPLLLTSQITDSTNISCFVYSDGIATITPSGGTTPYLYLWDDLAGTTDSTVTGLMANQYYHVTINDVNGCTIEDSVMLSEPVILLSSVTDSSNISCHGFSDGSATITVTGGTRPYAYLWDDQASTTDSIVTGLPANQYFHVTINDAKGCSHKDSVILSEPDELTTDITDSTNISCFGYFDGIATVTPSGGTTPYFYLWDDLAGTTDSTVRGLMANQYYHVTINDAKGCSLTDSVILSQPTLLRTTMTDSTNISCFGFSDGTATVTPSGGTPPYTYYWDDPVNTTDSTVSGLLANKYFHVNVTDAHDCSITDSILLSQPDQLNINPYYSDTICLNSSDGFIGTNPSGGIPPYDYIWSSGETVQSLTDLEAGEYRVTVTDNHGCQDLASFTIHNAVPYGEEKICVVTVDLLTGQNMVIWEKTPDKGIQDYNIYREDELIGTVAYNDLSIFKDTVANPETRPFLYYISVVDTCGNESGKSPYHKPLFLQYVSSVDGVNLRWSNYVIEGGELTFANYSILRGSDSTSLAPFAENIPTVVDVYTDNDPSALERKYYYRVAGILNEPCYPSDSRKAGSGPYHHSLSNMDDNKLMDPGDTTGTYIYPLASQDMLIFPNPFSDYTTIVFPNNERAEYRMILYDMMGKIVWMKEGIREYRIRIQRSQLSPGYYHVELVGPKLFRGILVVK